MSKTIIYGLALLLVLQARVGMGQTANDSLPEGGKIILEGNYEEKNVYIQNPFAGTGIGFCVLKVFVNGRAVEFESSSAFEIPLKSLGLALGDPVKIVIVHKNDCKPKVIYDHNSHPKGTFEVTGMAISPDGMLKWTTKNEKAKLPFIVELYRWNRWIKIGEVEGKGGPGENSYEFKIIPHSGENNVRVKQVDYTSQPRFSKPVTFISTVKEVKILDIDKSKKEISLSAETMYRIYDKSGNIVKTGTEKIIDCSELKYGRYYLDYDNKTEEVVFKKKK